MTDIYEIIIGRGEDIKEAITAFVLDKGWTSAYISGGIGSVQEVCLTTPVDGTFPPVTEDTHCPGPGELLAFTGEIMKRELMDPALEGVYKEQGPLFVHIHASAAFRGGQVRGGGFHQGKAFRAVKVYIRPM